MAEIVKDFFVFLCFNCQIWMGGRTTTPDREFPGLGLSALFPKLLDLCCMSSHPSKSDSRSCWKQIFHICFFAWCSVRRIYVMSSDAKACYTKADVRAAPIKYGVFLFVQWRWNSGNREAHWRTRFLLFGGSSECSAQGNTEYLIGAARPPFPKHSS